MVAEVDMKYTMFLDNYGPRYSHLFTDVGWTYISKNREGFKLHGRSGYVSKYPVHRVEEVFCRKGLILW